MSDELFDLTGKTALITGASSGLGERFAITLASRGAKVILAARRLDLLKKIALAIERNSGSAMVVSMDVADKNSIKQAMANLANEKIDILVNNAGIYRDTPIFSSEEDESFEEIIQINLIGLWHMTKQVAIHMKNNKIPGSIINIASIYGANKVGAGATGYCASKAAVIQLSKALVGELAENNIRINSIAPGFFVTPMNNTEIEELAKKINPLGYIAKPEELDGLILYLASNKASNYVTGSCFTVDGGLSWGG